jgi:glucose-specific phosphotransferase system IIA component
MKALGTRVFSSLQQLGQALMVPVSVLPAAGLLLAFGRILFDGNEKDPHSISYRLGKVLYASGLSVFEQLSLIFAIGVALGFTGNAGVSGLAAVTGYFAFATVLKTFSEILELPSAINAGVLGGILVGYLVSALYNRYHQVRLPQVLGFFSGKRLVPILSVAASVLLALVFVVVWPPVQSSIHDFGEAVMGSEFGPSIFASVKRLLIPVGLHHVFYPSFLYEFGDFTTAAGKVVHGDATRYFAGDPTAGRFMASEFPLMIFGLPAAALAMTLRARPERRQMIGGVMLSAALTSIITGITEPIEFAYTFVAPSLYLAHAALAFLVGWMTSFFDIHLGYTFSSSLIDLGIGFFNQKNISMLFLVVGPVTALLYFGVFYWAIGFFDFKTPGREIDTGTEEAPEAHAGNAGDPSETSLRKKARAILAAIGGGSNIHRLNACITRLRLVLRDDSKVDAAALKALGASGILKAGGGNVQIVFGVESDFLKSEIEGLQRETGTRQIASPLLGRVLAPSEIPDPTFRDGLLGKTVAILPESGEICAPFAGTVATLFHTQHAIGLLGDDGVELLIHIGIDTVKLNGEGFQARVKAGDRVEAGQRLIDFDLPFIEKHAKSIVTPIVITNPEAVRNLTPAEPGKTLNAGECLWSYN